MTTGPRARRGGPVDERPPGAPVLSRATGAEQAICLSSAVGSSYWTSAAPSVALCAEQGSRQPPGGRGTKSGKPGTRTGSQTLKTMTANLTMDLGSRVVVARITASWLGVTTVRQERMGTVLRTAPVRGISTAARRTPSAVRIAADHQDGRSSVTADDPRNNQSARAPAFSHGRSWILTHLSDNEIASPDSCRFLKSQLCCIAIA